MLLCNLQPRERNCCVLPMSALHTLGSFLFSCIFFCTFFLWVFLPYLIVPFSLNFPQNMYALVHFLLIFHLFLSFVLNVYCRFSLLFSLVFRIWTVTLQLPSLIPAFLPFFLSLSLNNPSMSCQTFHPHVTDCRFTLAVSMSAKHSGTFCRLSLQCARLFFNYLALCGRNLTCPASPCFPRSCMYGRKPWKENKPFPKLEDAIYKMQFNAIKKIDNDCSLACIIFLNI